jgi:hypothetical protein
MNLSLLSLVSPRVTPFYAESEHSATKISPPTKWLAAIEKRTWLTDSPKGVALAILSLEVVGFLAKLTKISSRIENVNR